MGDDIPFPAPKTDAIDWEAIQSFRDNLTDLHDDQTQEDLETMITVLAYANLEDAVGQADEDGMADLLYVVQLCMEFAYKNYNDAEDYAVKIENKYRTSDPTKIEDSEHKEVYERRERELEEKVAELDRNLFEALQNCEKFQAECDEAKTEARKESRRAKELQEDVKEIREKSDQLDFDNRGLKKAIKKLEDTQKGGHDALKDKMGQLRDLNDIIDRVSEERDMAKQEWEETAALLESALEEFGKKEEEMNEQTRQAEEIRKENDKLEQMNGDLETRCSELESSLNAFGKDDDRFMGVVNEKLQVVKKILTEKEEEIYRLQQEIKALQRKLTAKERQLREKETVHLEAVVEEKEDEIRSLTMRLRGMHDHAATMTEGMTNQEKALMQAKNDTSAKYEEKVTNLMEELTKKNNDLRTLEAEQKDVIAELMEKEEELLDANDRIVALVSDEPQLPKAIEDIRNLKRKLHKQKQLLEATILESNKLQFDLDFFEEENCVYREKFGPLSEADIKAIATSKDRELQKQAALIQQYRDDIDELEDEVLELKACLREKVMEEGGGLDDGEDAGSFVRQKTLARRHKKGVYEQRLAREKLYADSDEEGTVIVQQVVASGGANAEESKMMVEKISDLSVKLTKAQTSATVNEERAQSLTAENSKLLEENRMLSDGLGMRLDDVVQEIQKQLSSTGDDNNEGLSPTLTKVIELWKNKIDLKAKLSEEKEKMEARGVECKRLEAQIREGEFEEQRLHKIIERQKVEMEAKDMDVAELRQQIHQLIRGTGQSMALSASLRHKTAVKGFNGDAIEEIATLSSQLLECLELLALKERETQGLERELNDYRARMDDVVAQKGLLYTEFAGMKSSNEEAVVKWKKRAADAQLAAEKAGVYEHELEKLRKTLGTGGEQAALIEATKKSILLQNNQKTLTRQYNNLLEEEKFLRKNNDALKQDVVELEDSTKVEIEYLQNNKKYLEDLVASLLKKVDASVPAEDYQLITRKLHVVANKYRALLEVEQDLVMKVADFDHVKAEGMISAQKVEELLAKKESLEEHNKTLVREKAALMALQESTDIAEEVRVQYQTVAVLKNEITTLRTSESTAVRQLSVLTKKQERIDAELSEAEERTARLDVQLLEANAERGDTEEENISLREKLRGAIVQDEAKAITEKLEKLEEQVSWLQRENAVLKKGLERRDHTIAQTNLRRDLKRVELESLHTLREMQKKDDASSAMGRLCLENMHLSTRNKELAHALDACQKELGYITQLHQNSERERDMRQTQVHELQSTALDRKRSLQSQINEMRTNLRSAVKLEVVENMNEKLAKVAEDKAKIEEQYVEAQAALRAAQDDVAETHILLEQQRELVDALSHGDLDDKVKDWHDKVTDLLVAEARLSRRVATGEQAVDRLQEDKVRHEEVITKLEEDLVRAKADYETSLTTWEQRETALEQQLQQKDRDREVLFVAMRAETRHTRPDPSKPLAKQLEDALTQLDDKTRVVGDMEATIEAQDKRMQEQAAELSRAESEVLKRDLELVEYRKQITEGVGRLAIKNEPSVFEAHKQEVAQQNLNKLHLMLERRDQAVLKWKTMLENEREAHRKQRTVDAGEIASLQEQLQQQHEEASSRLNKMMNDMTTQQRMQELNSKMPEDAVTANEVEQHLREKSRKIAQLTMQVEVTEREMKALQKRAESEVQELRERSSQMIREAQERADKEIQETLERTNREIRENMDRTAKETREMASIANDHQRKADELERQLNNQEHEFEVAVQEERARAPPKELQRLVSKLKNQLALKEAKVKELQKAIRELNDEMMKVAVGHTHAPHLPAGSNNGSVDVQLIVEEQTQHLHARLNDVLTTLAQTRDDIVMQKEEKAALKAQYQRSKDEIRRREKKIDSQNKEMRKLRAEVKSLRGKIDGGRSSHATSEEIGKRKREEYEQRIRDLQEQLLQQAEQLNEREVPGKRTPEPLKERGIPSASTPPSGKTRPASKGGDGGGASAPRSQSGRTTESTARWEAEKRWQRRVDTLKQKLKEQTTALEASDKQVRMLRETIGNVEREKNRLQQKLSAARKPARLMAGDATTATALEELNEKVFALEEVEASLRREAEELQRQVTVAQQERDHHKDRVQSMTQRMARAKEGRRSEDVEVAATEAELAEANERVRELEQQQLEQSNQVMELRFDLERAGEKVPNLERRISELMAYIETLKSSPPTQQQKKKDRIPAGTKDLELTVAGMKRAMEKLQSENESLKKTSHSNVKYLELLKESKKSKKRQAELQTEIDALKASNDRAKDAHEKMAKLGAENEKWQHKAKKEEKKCNKIKNDLVATKAELDMVTRELAEVQRAKDSAVRSQEVATVRNEILMADQADHAEARLGKIDEERAIAQSSAAALKDTAAQRIAELEHELAQRDADLDAFRALQKESRGGDVQELLKDNTELRRKLERARGDRDLLSRDLTTLNQQLRPLLKGAEPAATLKKADAYDKLLVEHKAVLRERDDLEKSNKELKGELQVFDPKFFDEIEELKYKYKSAMRVNRQYERLLRKSVV